MENKINKLEKILHVKFKNPDLLLQALTHKSFNSLKNYETLEFLGDRVLGFVISKRLIDLYPHAKVGLLDKKLASVVNKKMCLKIGNKYKLHRFILVGNKSNKKTNIVNKIISDSCESIIGAIYLDSGFEIVRKFILKSWDDFLSTSIDTKVDPKTQLQEFSLKKYKILPMYKLISNTGPRHKPNFKVGVKITNTNFVYSYGSSKKNAEQSAAMELLKTLKNI